MFAHLSSKGITARSFGGLRMTMMGGTPRDDASLFTVILRPPKDLAVYIAY
jgi:hypothetical protein